MNQFLSFHDATVKDVKDPWGVGRVRCECPDLLGKGKKNWTGWVQVIGAPIGGGDESKGDQGAWLPLQPQQTVYLGFLSGHPQALFAIPGPPYQQGQKTGKDRNKQLTPLEVKTAGKNNPRDATRLRILKSEAGHTLLFDDRGQREKLALIDSLGAGLFMSGPGKDEDEQESEGEESKPRKGKRRGTKMVATGTSESVKDATKDGHYYMGLMDANGGGIWHYAGDGKGILAIFAATENGKIGPSILFDAEKKNTFISSGPVQLVLAGEKGWVTSTHMLLKASKRADVETCIEGLARGVKNAFSEFNGDDGQDTGATAPESPDPAGGGSGSGDSGGSGDTGGGDNGGAVLV